MSAAWSELWSAQRLGSKLSAAITPDGQEISIGITNLLSRTGTAERISRAQARALAFAILDVTGGRGE